MTKHDDPIGRIACPWCKRQAEVHRFDERKKLDPAGGDGKAAYPVKVFVICPPITGYRGCGTTLANSREAQARIMETAHIFGAADREALPAEAPKPGATPAPAKSTQSAPPAPPAEKKRTSIFDW